MKKSDVTPVRSRGEIIAEMASLDLVMRGAITTQKRTLSDGTVKHYYHLQRWENGKNRTTYIPGELLDAVSAALAEGSRLEALSAELDNVDAKAVLSGSQVKKKRSKSSRI